MDELCKCQALGCSVRISRWEEESGVQVALHEAKKLCGQAGVTPG